MKKSISIALCLMVVLSSFGFTPTFTAAETVYSKVGTSSGISGTCTWELNDDGLLTIRANETINDDTDESYGTMRNYSDIAYYLMPPWRSQTNKVIIEEGVTSIGDFAFYECKNIQSISIPDSVTHIGYRAFERCYNLTSVTIGGNVTDIESEAFYNCTSLKSVTIPNNVARINIRAFGYYYDYDLQTTIKIDNFTIYGTTGSVAEKYAKANGFTFIPTQRLLGDVDGDQKITINDATFIQMLLAEYILPFEIDNDVADTNEDGIISISDVTFIQRWLANLKSNDNLGKPLN